MPHNTRTITWILAVGVLGLVAAAALHHGFGAMRRDVYLEVVQFFLIVVLGSGISFIVQQSAQAKAQRDAEKQVLARTYDELLKAYNKAKRARRLLRARVLTAPTDDTPAHATPILAADYDEQMEKLIDAELDFDSIERRIKNNERVFEGPGCAELEQAIKEIGDYLHLTVEEFEDQRTEFAGDPAQSTLGKLPVLTRFIGTHGSDPKYWSDFKLPFRTALRILRHEVRGD